LGLGNGGRGGGWLLNQANTISMASAKRTTNASNGVRNLCGMAAIMA